MWIGADKANGYGTILKLLLLTGCRRDEIGGLLWSEVELKTRTKNKQEHVVPLSDTAMSIFAGIAKRDGWSSAKAEFDAVVRLDDWVVHDLRRTVRTGIDKLGTPPHICEAVLNHLPPKLVRTYNRNTYYEAEKPDGAQSVGGASKGSHRSGYLGQCYGSPQQWLGGQQEALIFVASRSHITAPTECRNTRPPLATSVSGIHEI